MRENVFIDTVHDNYILFRDTSVLPTPLASVRLDSSNIIDARLSRLPRTRAHACCVCEPRDGRRCEASHATQLVACFIVHAGLIVGFIVIV